MAENKNRREGETTRRQTEHKGDMTVREAGHKGGETVRDKYGPEFYSEIGHKGGERVRELIEEGKESESGGSQEQAGRKK
jgi:general stress protein YciG